MSVDANMVSDGVPWTQYIGDGWNRFWFVPRSPNSLQQLARLVSLAALVWLGLMSFELTSMFGSEGWLSAETVHQVTTNGDVTQPVPGFSYLFWVRTPGLLWAAHVVSLAVVALAAWGKWGRVTTVLTWLIVVTYVQRGPMVTGAFELVLCMLLGYLGVGRLFIDYADDRPTWIANIITRLIQLHLCGLYVVIATSKLGTPAWWTGDATWYLLQDRQHGLLDLSFLANYALLGNAVTHCWLLVELLFPVLIWNRALRPLIVVLSTIVWLATAVLTGWVGYAFIMVAANLVFVDRGARPPGPAPG